MAWAIKMAVFIWPLVRELILGDTNIKDAVKNNKFRVFLIAMIISSFLLNAFLIYRLWTISHDYLVLKNKYGHLVTPGATASKPSPPASAPLKAPPMGPPPVTPVSPDNRPQPKPGGNTARGNDEIERYKRIKKRFEEMQADDRS